MAPIRTACDRTYKASRHSGTRPLAAVRLIVWHDTEGGTARDIARYFHSPLAKGSTHLVVDDASCFRCLTNDQEPWGAQGANYNGFHIEQCGFARWPRRTWLRHLPMLRRCAYKTALHCRLFGIPVRFVDAGGLEDGRAGITTHAQASKAFGGSHSDPGSGYPLGVVLAMTRAYRAQLAAVDALRRLR